MFTDALSTACFVAGLEEGMEIVEKYDSEAVFVTDDNKVYLTDGLKDTFEIVKDGYTLAELG